VPGEWPAWWYWDVRISPHTLERMVDRRRNEADLRLMLESAYDYREDIIDGRWVVVTEHDMRPWEVIVEPDADLELLIIVTAFSVEA